MKKANLHITNSRTTRSRLKALISAILILASLLPVGVLGQSSDFTGPDGRCINVPECACKWSGARRTADCSNAGLVKVPVKLSHEVQSLILDGNPLKILPDDVFKSAGLLNLQTLSLKRCGLVGRVGDSAFRDLKVLQRLDLSHNNLTSIAEKTFDGNDRLRQINLAFNPITELTDHQFPPLNELRVIDLSHCAIERVATMAFNNLGASMETVLLDHNKLTNLQPSIFMPLVHLRELSLHDNEWNCNCELNNFKDWVMNKKMYAHPTVCSEPSRLFGKTWDALRPNEFACKPDISIPFARVFGAPGVDATLSCRIRGSPVPSAKWVAKGRILNNGTNPRAFAAQTYVIGESLITSDGVNRWYNLTIKNPSVEDIGVYLCVAENSGGVMERDVELTFEEPGAFDTMGIPVTHEQLNIIIGVAVAVFMLFLVVIALCCYCYCSKKRRRKAKGHPKTVERSNSNVHGGFDPNQTKPLLPDGAQQYQIAPRNTNGSMTLLRHQQQRQSQRNVDLSQMEGYGLEMGEMRPNTSSSTASNNVTTNGNGPKQEGSGGSSSGGSELGTTATIRTANSRASFTDSTSPAFITSADNNHPDVVPNPHLYSTLQHPHHHFMAAPYPHLMKTSSPMASSGHPHHMMPHSLTLQSLSPAGLMHQNGGGSQHLPQYPHLFNSPFQRSGTLPINRQTPQQLPADLQQYVQLQQLPQQVPHPHQHQQPQAVVQQQRPGYVTLPRRPRNASWSIPRETPSPGSTVSFLREFREPIYDGVGPRTSADGSSTLQKVKTPKSSTASAGAPGQLFSQPILEEGVMAPPTPKQQQSRMAPNLPKSTPNMLELSDTFKQYQERCKEEGKNNDDDTNVDSSMATSMTTSGSEGTLMEEENISSYMEPFGKALKPTTEDEPQRVQKFVPNSSSNNKRHSSTSAESELEAMLKSSASQQNEAENSQQKKKVPPKTLPKPKVKPVPPPKPKKSFSNNPTNGDMNLDSSSAPLISFQDEGADGSEV